MTNGAVRDDRLTCRPKAVADIQRRVLLLLLLLNPFTKPRVFIALVMTVVMHIAVALVGVVGLAKLLC